MSSEAGSVGLDAGQTVVLNALVDLFAGETIVLDGESEGRLRAVVEAVTTPEERSSARDELDRLTSLDRGQTSEFPSDLAELVETVTSGLADRGYSVSVSHEYRQAVSALDAHVYSFVNTGDPDHLRALEMDPAVERPLVEAIDDLGDGADDGARSRLSEAVDRSGTHTERVAARVVAAWGCFRAGDDEAALDHVDRALELENSSWAARVVGASVKRNEHDTVRAGKRRVGIVLRWVASGPEGTSTRAEVGGRSGSEPLAWYDVPHLNGHGFVDRLFPETRIKFTLRGALPAFPQLEAYFIGLGVYDADMEYIDTVIERFGSGPHNEGAVERIAIDR